eukprot:g4625.t1
MSSPLSAAARSAARRRYSSGSSASPTARQALPVVPGRSSSRLRPQSVRFNPAERSDLRRVETLLPGSLSQSQRRRSSARSMRRISTSRDVTRSGSNSPGISPRMRKTNAKREHERKLAERISKNISQTAKSRRLTQEEIEEMQKRLSTNHIFKAHAPILSNHLSNASERNGSFDQSQSSDNKGTRVKEGISKFGGLDEQVTLARDLAHRFAVRDGNEEVMDVSAWLVKKRPDRSAWGLHLNEDERFMTLTYVTATKMWKLSWYKDAEQSKEVDEDSGETKEPSMVGSVYCNSINLSSIKGAVPTPSGGISFTAQENREGKTRKYELIPAEHMKGRGAKKTSSKNVKNGSQGEEAPPSRFRSSTEAEGSNFCARLLQVINRGPRVPDMPENDEVITILLHETLTEMNEPPERWGKYEKLPSAMKWEMVLNAAGEAEKDATRAIAAAGRIQQEHAKGLLSIAACKELVSFSNMKRSWLITFFDNQGFFVIFDALHEYELVREANGKWTSQQVQAVELMIKFFDKLLETKLGIDLVLATDDAVMRLCFVLDLDFTRNEKIATQVCKLLNRICFATNEDEEILLEEDDQDEMTEVSMGESLGHMQVVEAFRRFSEEHTEVLCFSSLISAIKNGKSLSLGLACLNLATWIVQREPLLNDRIALRNEFLQLRILEACSEVEGRWSRALERAFLRLRAVEEGMKVDEEDDEIFNVVNDNELEASGDGASGNLPLSALMNAKKSFSDRLRKRRMEMTKEQRTRSHRKSNILNQTLNSATLSDLNHLKSELNAFRATQTLFVTMMKDDEAEAMSDEFESVEQVTAYIKACSTPEYNTYDAMLDILTQMAVVPNDTKFGQSVWDAVCESVRNLTACVYTDDLDKVSNEDDMRRNQLAACLQAKTYKDHVEYQMQDLKKQLESQKAIIEAHERRIQEEKASTMVTAIGEKAVIKDRYLDRISKLQAEQDHQLKLRDDRIKALTGRIKFYKNDMNRLHRELAAAETSMKAVLNGSATVDSAMMDKLSKLDSKLRVAADLGRAEELAERLAEELTLKDRNLKSLEEELSINRKNLERLKASLNAQGRSIPHLKSRPNVSGELDRLEIENYNLRKEIEALKSGKMVPKREEKKISTPVEVINVSVPLNFDGQKYNSMIRSKMSVDQVKAKMKADGHPQTLINAIDWGSTSNDTGTNKQNNVECKLIDRPEYAKYKRMLKVLPRPNLVGKMKVDGLNAALIEAILDGKSRVESSTSEVSSERTKGVTKKTSSTVTPSGKTLLFDLPEYSKYKVMKKMNMPEAQIIGKMKRDGLDKDLIDAIIAGESAPYKPKAKVEKSKTDKPKEKKTKFIDVPPLPTFWNAKFLPLVEVLVTSKPKLKKSKSLKQCFMSIAMDPPIGLLPPGYSKDDANEFLDIFCPKLEEEIKESNDGLRTGKIVKKRLAQIAKAELLAQIQLAKQQQEEALSNPIASKKSPDELPLPALPEGVPKFKDEWRPLAKALSKAGKAIKKLKQTNALALGPPLGMLPKDVSKEVGDAFVEWIAVCWKAWRNEGGKGDDGKFKRKFNGFKKFLKPFGADIVAKTKVTAALAEAKPVTGSGLVELHFNLYDHNKNGMITKDEMKQTLELIYSVLYDMGQDVEKQMGKGFRALADSMTTGMFDEADTNRDGMISFQEFSAKFKVKEKSLKETLMDDKRYKKFFRAKEMVPDLPANQLRYKMKSAKIPEDVQDQLIAVMFPKTGGADDAGGGHSNQVVTDKADVKPKEVMRTIQWKPVPPEQLETSVFKELSDGWVLSMLQQMGDAYIIEKDKKEKGGRNFESDSEDSDDEKSNKKGDDDDDDDETALTLGEFALENYFVDPRSLKDDKKKVKKVKEKKKKSPKKKKQTFIQCTFQIEVGMSKFIDKGKDLRKALLNMDDKSFTPPLIKKLLDLNPKKKDAELLFPNKETLDQIFALDDDSLKPADLFFKDLLQGIPNPYQRMSCLYTIATFGEQVSHIEEYSKLLTQACTKVLASKRFKKFLEIVLGIGNYLNAGTRIACQYGYDIFAMINQLSILKTNDGDRTLMTWIVMFLEQHATKDDVLGLSSEWEPLRSVIKVMPNDLRLRIADLKKKLKECEGILNEKNRDEKNDKFTERCSLFLDNAKKLIPPCEKRYKESCVKATELLEKLNMGEYVWEREKTPVATILITPSKFSQFWEMLLDIPTQLDEIRLQLKEEKEQRRLLKEKEKAKALRKARLREARKGNVESTNIKHQMKKMAEGGAQSMIEKERQRIDARRRGRARKMKGRLHRKSLKALGRTLSMSKGMKMSSSPNDNKMALKAAKRRRPTRVVTGRRGGRRRGDSSGRGKLAGSAIDNLLGADGILGNGV